MWKITFFWSEIGSGFEEPGGRPPPRIPRSTPPGLWASLNSSVDVISFFLSNGADVYSRDYRGQTAFLYACRRNVRSVVEFLARKGTRIHDIDGKGQLRIHHATLGNKRDVLELLIWVNYMPIITSQTGETGSLFILPRQADTLKAQCFCFRIVIV